MKLALRLLVLALLLSTATLSGADFTTTTQNQGNRFTSALDWTAPGIDLSVPAGALRGSVTLSAEASDAHSGIASVAFQIREWGTDDWTDLCVHESGGLSAAAAYECLLDTTGYQDGTYELRAVAVDLEGNAQSSPVADRVFDNTAPTVSLTDPGSPLHGAVTLSATASDATSGVATVRFYAAATGTGAWTQLCASTTTPYTCVLDTTTLADGRYDFRAVAVDAAGNEAQSVVTDRVVDNRPLTVTLLPPPDAVRGTVTLTAEVFDPGTGVASVRIQRRLSGTTTWTDICTDTTAPYTCAWNTVGLVEDDYDLRAIATAPNGSTATSAVVQVTVDNTLPTVTMLDPGTPLRGTVDLRANADDSGSGVAAVTIQIAPSGTATWVTICTDETAPYSCRFNTTTYPDGSYGFRAIAVDAAGNSRTSNTVNNRMIDNTVSAVSLADPGALLRGNELLQADASSSAGITSVRIERAPAGTTTWTAICTVTTAPYQCTWDTRTVPDGLYDLRAVLLDGANRTTISATVAGRRVDNAPVRGVDVQAFNVAGGTAGRIEPGDGLVLTYSEQMAPGSILPGWDGAPRAILFRIRDGKSIGLGSSDDTVDLFADAGLTVPVRAGTVNLRGDHIKGTAVLNATLTQQTISLDGKPVTSLTVTVGTLVSGSGIRIASAGTMIWTPSSAALDLSGVACSTAPVTESGPLDRDF